MILDCQERSAGMAFRKRQGLKFCASSIQKNEVMSEARTAVVSTAVRTTVSSSVLPSSLSSLAQSPPLSVGSKYSLDLWQHVVVWLCFHAGVRDCFLLAIPIPPFFIGTCCSEDTWCCRRENHASPPLQHIIDIRKHNNKAGEEQQPPYRETIPFILSLELVCVYVLLLLGL